MKLVRFFKWVWNSWCVDWWLASCHHCNKYGEQCTRIDCHPGPCETTQGALFYPDSED